MSDPNAKPLWQRAFSRRNFLRLGGAGVAGAGLSTGYVFKWEPEFLEITRRRITLLPIGGGEKVVRAVQLSDLHASECVSMSYLRRAVKMAVELKPDLFLMTGDYITSKDFHQHDEFIEVLRPLADAAPTYATLGNHDGGSWAGSTYGHPDSREVQDILAKAGIQLLLNDIRRLEFHGAPLLLVGLGDFWNEEDFLPSTAFGKLRKGEWAAPPARPPIVLMSHNPDSKRDLHPYPWDLMLCGHTHGGQMVVPFLDIRPFLPIRDKRFREGLYAWGGRQIHITRGIGNLHGARINCRPEISQLDLVVG
jgi:predicted MPP superfamily phosphohydrolase